jgi:4-hydroxy-tetrahydrodipicolinate synthase
VITLADSALRGSYPPLVTPVDRDGAVDGDAFAESVSRQVEGGSHGVVVTGTTGEPSLLSVEERIGLYRIATQTAAGRIPVVAATGAASLDDTLRLCAAAVDASADALLVVTPYFVRPPQRGLVEYYTTICARFDLPVLVYHIPGRAAVGVDAATLEQIAEAAPNFVGMKHAASDVAIIGEAHRRLGAGFRIFAGLEQYSLPMLAAGACGLMNAVGNLVPGMLAAMCDHVLRGDLHAAQAIDARLGELNDAIFWDTNPIPLKYMLRRLGLVDGNRHRLPMVPASPELERRLDAVLQRAGLLSESVAVS